MFVHISNYTIISYYFYAPEIEEWGGGVRIVFVMFVIL